MENEYSLTQYNKLTKFLETEFNELSIRQLKKKYRCLVLPMTQKYFDLIKNGVKKAEYRNLNNYYYSRLYDKKTGLKKVFDYVIFTAGYPKDTELNRILVRRYWTFRTCTGIEKWGAEKNKLYYSIWFNYFLDSKL